MRVAIEVDLGEREREGWLSMPYSAHLAIIDVTRCLPSKAKDHANKNDEYGV